MSYTYHDRAEVRQLRLKNSKEKKKEESKIKRQTSQQTDRVERNKKAFLLMEKKNQGQQEKEKHDHLCQSDDTQ